MRHTDILFFTLIDTVLHSVVYVRSWKAPLVLTSAVAYFPLAVFRGSRKGSEFRRDRSASKVNPRVKLASARYSDR